MSATHLPRIAEALSRPLLFHPTKLEVILSALDVRLGVEAEKPGPEASRFLGRRENGRPYSTQDGIAFIHVIGSLANRGAYIGASSGVVSYEGLAAQIRTAVADESVHSIVLDIDSGGGEATGMFRLAGLLRQARASKRLVAFVDDMAASAAYGIASQAHEIVVSPTSIVGSIGVVLAHIDRSAEMEKLGRKVTLIHAGANKVDGHPFAALSESVRADLQRDVEAFREQFLSAVAAGRPRMTAERARATEARTYIGQAAIDAGLADRIGTIDSIVADLLNRNAARPRNRGLSMSTNTPTPFASATLAAAISASLSAGAPDPTGILAQFAAAGAPALSQAQVDVARAEGKAEGLAAGASAERERISGILATDEGKANPEAALALALDPASAAFPLASVQMLLKHAGPAKAPAASASQTPPAGTVEQRVAENPLGLMPGAAAPQPEKPKSGLAKAVAEMVAADAKRAGF